MLEIEAWVRDLLEKALEGERLTEEEGARLYHAPLPILGMAADGLRRSLAGDLATFVIDRNINYTNACVSGCKFCAFYRPPRSGEAYVLGTEELLEKVREAVALDATQVLLQGGLNPDLHLEYYERILRALKDRFPQVQRHALSPTEIAFIAHVEKSSVGEVLLRLKEAGLQSIPGGGAEILDDDVRARISPRKLGWEGWMGVMREAHRLGIPSTATMVYGLTEGVEERVRHILRVRELQEETRGFTAFIPWSFQPQNTRLAMEYGVAAQGGAEYLRVVALSRLLLGESIRNVQASWVTQGPKVAQIALCYGANDFGGTMIEENVVRAAGARVQYLPPEEIVRLISDLGREAAQRDTLYNILRRY